MSVDRFDIMNQQIELAREEAKTYRGPCETCRWYYHDFISAYCTHPVVDAIAFNQSDRDHAQYVTLCKEQRNVRSVWGPAVCGPDGVLHEKKIPWWRRWFLGERYESDR